MRRLGWIVPAGLVPGLLACGGLAPVEVPDPPADAPAGAPERPFTGAPVAAADAAIDGGELRWWAWSFHDAALLRFAVVVQFTDAAGNVVRTKAGTPFESDHADRSFSGGGYVLPPGVWQEVEAGVEVPPGAVSAVVLYGSVGDASGDVWRLDPDAMWSDPFPVDTPGPDLARWRRPAWEQAFQGILVMSPMRGREAWETTGDRVRVWDGAQTQSGTLSFPFPCAVRRTLATPGGGAITESAAFASTGAGLSADGHAHGLVAGDDALVCHDGWRLTALEGGTCTGWTRRSGSWFPTPATCAFSEVDGHRELDVDGTRLRVDGEALVSTSVAPGDLAVRAADWAAAKALVAEP